MCGNKNIFTTQSQGPSEVPLRNGQAIEVLDRGSTNKWVGYMLCTANTNNHASDLVHHLQAASKAFYAHRLFLINRKVTTRDRFKYFDAMSLLLLVFGAAQREVCKEDLCKVDIVFRQLVRSIVGPPGDVDWRCRGMKSFTIGMNESWLENICLLWDNIGNLLTMCPVSHKSNGLMGCSSIEKAPRTCSTIGSIVPTTWPSG